MKTFKGYGSGYGSNTSYEVTGFEAGMTLRDYFAAQALPMVMQQSRPVHDLDNTDRFIVAAAAYRIADMMLKVREVQS